MFDIIVFKQLSMSTFFHRHQAQDVFPHQAYGTESTFYHAFGGEQEPGCFDEPNVPLSNSSEPAVSKLQTLESEELWTFEILNPQPQILRY